MLGRSSSGGTSADSSTLRPVKIIWRGASVHHDLLTTPSLIGLIGRSFRSCRACRAIALDARPRISTESFSLILRGSSFVLELTRCILVLLLMDLPVPLGHVIGNKYRVDSLIGSGGMGVVVAGYHLELDQPIAIKFLSVDKEVCVESAERFRREARTAARIHSEHAVKVYDSGLVGVGVPYMVMELLEGNDLGQELAKQGPLPLSLAAHYLLQAIDAIAEAHAMGVVHRDLKPGNLFLARGADGTRSIKVLDFGISKSVTRASDIVLTRTASMIGSPLYMSPEQMRSARDVDARSDIWSLGAILYELVSGEPPFPAESIPELCVAVMNDTLRPISTLVAGAPLGLDVLLARCLNKNLAERFATAADLADALVEFAPTSRRFAERARRLLSTPSVRASLMPEVHGAAYASGYPTRLAPTSSVDGRAPSRPSATQTSWGQTGRASMSKRSIPFVVGGVLILGVIGALGWEALKPKVSESTSSASASAGEGVSAAAEIAALKPAPDESDPAKLEPEPPPIPSADPAVDPEASAPARPTPPVAVRPPVRSLPRSADVPGQRTVPVPRPQAVPPPPKPSAGKPGTITDFGGRRF